MHLKSGNCCQKRITYYDMRSQISCVTDNGQHVRRKLLKYHKYFSGVPCADRRALALKQNRREVSSRRNNKFEVRNWLFEALTDSYQRVTFWQLASYPRGEEIRTRSTVVNVQYSFQSERIFQYRGWKKERWEEIYLSGGAHMRHRRFISNFSYCCCCGRKKKPNEI